MIGRSDVTDSCSVGAERSLQSAFLHPKTHEKHALCHGLHISLRLFTPIMHVFHVP
jgi:hypothetical protein